MIAFNEIEHDVIQKPVPTFWHHALDDVPEEETAMMMVAATPFASLLLLLFIIPVGVIVGVIGTDCMSILRDKPRSERS